jgi:NADH-quinone oxidoreductase subunit J
MEPHYPLFYVFHFYLFGVIALASALAFVTRKSPVPAALWLVNTMFSLAVLFVMLDAEFIGVMQVLVYAGAIMVLFIFVVMILNREEVAPLALRPMRVLGVVAGVYLTVKFAGVVSEGSATQVVPGVLPESYGTVAAVGDMLFREFLYPFEAISLLLLVAIVGGVVVSRSHQKEVAAQRAADYRKQVHDLASSDYPGLKAQDDGHTAHGGGGHH